MSLYKVPVTTVLDVTPHPNADRLELISVYSFQVISAKGLYQKGDAVIYVPVDSILPKDLEDFLFPVDSKIKLTNSRVRAAKIRQVVSQGLLIKPDALEALPKFNDLEVELEQDIKDILGITKYEPPTPDFQKPKGPTPGSRKALENPDFKKYNGIDNIKWFPNGYEGKEVIIQCKLHGSLLRVGKAPFIANTVFKKILKFLKLAPAYENVYGSNNVELTNRSGYTGFYGEDVYGKVCKKLKIHEKIKDGEYVYMELIGPGIQKNYTYGHTEHHAVLYDVKITKADGSQMWLNPEDAELYAKVRGFDFVPVLYRGPYSKEIVDQCTTGPSVYDPNEKVREGCVVKVRFGYDNNGDKQCLKSINPDYLLDRNNTDNH